MSPAPRAYPAPGRAMRPDLRSVLLAALLAMATFSLLPLFGLLSSRGRQLVQLRPAHTVPPPPPPPQVPAAKVEKPRPRPRPELEKRPQPSRPRRKVEPLRTAVPLTLASLRPEAGDFSLSFSLGAPSAPAVAGPAGPAAFSAADLDSQPRPLAVVKPMYPPAARRRGIEGFVEVRFTITPAGRVAGAEVLRSEPPGTFDRTALAAVRRWRFTPPRKDGKPVSARVRQTIRFRMEP